MEKKSIGQFIAVMRKANGLTQQEVADRLHVSNKTVSRWERDESAPDLSLVPALAELLGVTCDELLRGERIIGSADTKKKSEKTGKQLNALINHELYKFEVMVLIAITLAVFGLILIGICAAGVLRYEWIFLALFLEFAPLVISATAVFRAKMLRKNELLKQADAGLIRKFFGQVETGFLISFYLTAAVLWEIFLLLCQMGISAFFYYSGMADLLIMLLTHLLLLCPLAATFLPFKRLLRRYLELQPEEADRKTNFQKGADKRLCRKMTLLQGVMILLSAVLFVAAANAMFTEVFPFHKMTVQAVVFAVLGAAALLAASGVLILFILRHREIKKYLLFYGVRNLLLTVPVMLMVYGFLFNLSADHHLTGNRRYFLLPCLVFAVSMASLVILLFQIIAAVWKHKNMDHKDTF